MKRAGQFGIVGGQQDKAVSFGAKRLGQNAAAFGVARADDHQRASGQGAGRRNRIGQTFIVRQQCEQTRVEAGGGSC